MQGTKATAAWVAVAVACALSFALDLNNAANGGAIDLRNRITGVRLMERGLDAYTYKWHDGDPEEFGDVFNNPVLPISKTTATPALLVLHAPFAAMPYRVGQMAWLLAQWALLLGLSWLWVRGATAAGTKLLVAAFVAGFTYTAAWRLHAERGQAYVLLAFVFAAWLTATLNPKRGQGFVAGFCAGFLATLRPPFLLLAPVIALHRRGQALGLVVGLALGIGLPCLVHPACWSEYFSAMQVNAQLYRSGYDPRPGAQSYPATIEEIPTDLLGHFVDISYADFSVFALLLAQGVKSFPYQPVLLAVVVPFAIWLWLTRSLALERVVPGVAAWLFLVDLFLPAYRNNYNDVFILDVVAAGVVCTAKFPWAVCPAVAALPVGWAVYVFEPEQAWVINGSTFLFTLTAVGLMGMFSKSGASIAEKP